ncbi:MAG: bifunctional riboflavin kinase/FAD synthetase [Ruminococcaceae bacterium]|nr:bifunctional riboflavin kinase/FAD synthetase [Oscillospiraceae bacterium]
MKTALALGSFDGVHIAHRKVLDLPCDHKKTAVTFLEPPKMFFEGKSELITTYSDKVEILKGLGFDEIVSLDFERVKNTEPQDFLNYLFEKYNPAVISCGFNYRFGKNGMGDVHLLKNFCGEKGIECKICDEVKSDGVSVSSSLIRSLLKNGEIEKANTLLARPFSFTGEIIKGDGRGRTMGFPTVNQKYPQELVNVKFGVYKTTVQIDGECYDAVTNIGLRPTFKSDCCLSETYIKNFTGDLYGKNVRVFLNSFLRSEKKFASKEELMKQIKKDIEN